MKGKAPEVLQDWQRHFFKKLVAGKPDSERMALYTSAYAYRIEKSLEYDFPKTRKALGIKTFRNLTSEFVHKKGSHRNLLSELSEDFVRFLRRKRSSRKALPVAYCELAAMKVKRRARERVQGELSENSALHLSEKAAWVEEAQSLVYYHAGKVTIKQLNRTEALAARLLEKGTTLTTLAKRLARARLSSSKTQALFTRWASRGLIHWST